MKMQLLVAYLASIFASVAAAQNNFSCPYGTNGACLNYGDRVVNQNAACFDQYACGFKGFVCKSKLDDAVNEYNDVVNKYNSLRIDYNDTLSKNKVLIETASDLLERNKRLINELTNTQNERDEAIRQQQMALLENERLERQLADLKRKVIGTKPSAPTAPKGAKGADKTT